MDKRTSEETAILGIDVDEANDIIRGARGSAGNWKMKLTELYNYISGKLPTPPTTITARVSLNAAQLATLNSVPIDIPAFPAPGAGFAWQVTALAVKYSFVTIDYNFSQFWILTNAHIQPQGFITNSQINANYISQGTTGGYQSTMEANQKLQISSDFDDSALGDSTAIVYVIAQKITL